jgi:hypothetical protein
MLNAMKNPARQSGVVLVTGLLFLLVVTIIAVTAANNSTLGLKMSASMQDSYRSFQSAEAGLYAALGLAGTAPLRRSATIRFGIRWGTLTICPLMWTCFSSQQNVPARGLRHPAVDRVYRYSIVTITALNPNTLSWVGPEPRFNSASSRLLLGGVASESTCQWAKSPRRTAPCLTP